MHLPHFPFSSWCFSYYFKWVEGQKKTITAIGFKTSENSRVAVYVIINFFKKKEQGLRQDWGRRGSVVLRHSTRDLGTYGILPGRFKNKQSTGLGIQISDLILAFLASSYEIFPRTMSSSFLKPGLTNILVQPEAGWRIKAAHRMGLKAWGSTQRAKSSFRSTW